MMLLFTLGLAQGIEREAVLDKAVSYAVHTWTMTAANRYADCSSDYESSQDDGEKVGLPYGWGGYDTLDSFDAGLLAGEGAGAHSWDGILSCIVGVDCSGYVSRIWETGHYSTSTLYAVTSSISASAIERADAWNDPGSHVVLHAYETAAGTPVFYEAAGGADKVRINASSGWSYLSGYAPVRFEGIEAGPSSGTTVAPREIEAFPFEDLRWTAGAASDLFDVYNCAPDTDESGPEVVYHFTAAEAGLLSLTLSDDSGVDVDLHVLTALSTEACLARHDSALAVEVPAGEVYIVADTYVSGREYPGPYLLRAHFEPGATLPEEEEPSPDTGEAVDSAEPGEERPRLEEPRGTVDPDEAPSKGCSSLGGAGGAWLFALALLARRSRR
jgi:hypothetical protein